MRQCIASLLLVVILTITASCGTNPFSSANPSPTASCAGGGSFSSANGCGGKNISSSNFTTVNAKSSESTLAKYHSATNMGGKAASITGIRHLALRDTALSLGARAGLAWRANQINLVLARHERELDLVYNFNSMLLDNNVLPPVLIEGRQTLEQTSDDVIRVADRAYSIQAQARFVTMAPTWREYLRLEYKDPGLPDPSLLPRNEVEKNVWDRYLDEGWQAGVTQADVIFAENLGRLTRDYEGMIRYRTLLAQNMVSLPYVAHMNLGITGGDSQMAINDRVLRITALPEFNTAGNTWTTQITADDRQETPDNR